MSFCAEIGVFNLNLTQLTLKTSGVELLNFLQLTIAILNELQINDIVTLKH